jgi:hypothetical protein
MKSRPNYTKELQENAALMRSWRRWHRDELAAALAGPHGAMVERLVFILKNLTPQSGPLLLAYVRGVDWRGVDYHTRLIVLHEVNSAITRMRECAGMAPFDDGPPSAPMNVFQTIRGIVVS